MKAIRNDHYTYRVTWSEDDQEYVGLCAELPSLSWLAESQDAAWQGIRKLALVAFLGIHTGAVPAPNLGLKVHGGNSRTAKCFSYT